MWEEVKKAKDEKRCELVLCGPKINEHLSQGAVDPAIFQLSSLNYLRFSNCNLYDITNAVSELKNLQTLDLSNSKLTAININVFSLPKLKVLDVSMNTIKELPQEVEFLTQLTTLNLSSNELETLPSFKTNVKLATLNFENNKIVDITNICHSDLTLLSDVLLSGNKIKEIPAQISQLKGLKTLELASNEIEVIPGELSDCTKLKELKLKSNKIADRKLRKLIDQSRSTKQIIDYIKQNCARTIPAPEEKKNGSVKDEQESSEDEKVAHKFTINVLRDTNESLKIIVTNDVQTVRKHISACIVKNVQFTEEIFKKFIQLQTKLHDAVCQKRKLATIATHDLTKLGNGNLTYTAIPPKSLKIRPLNRNNELTGDQLFLKLKTEAETLRKEKKRNTYSGIHQYLHLLDGQKLYPCLLNANENVISFPPITNSEITKISPQTTSMFLEVTSSTGEQHCKHVLNTLLKEMVLLFNADIIVQQVRTVDNEDKLKTIYPAKPDLNFEKDVPIKVVRE